MIKQKIFITGGAGYVGSVLIPKLLKEGNQITVLDLMIYGENVLPENKNLIKVKGDIRNTSILEKYIPGHDTVIHLACISNDPSFEMNPLLGRSINYDAFEPLIKISKENNIKRFIYASSSSVYGIKSENNVHEQMSLKPLTDYSIFKAKCEKILAKYEDESFTTVTIRPATVCGFAPRQRLDVVVNILTNLAFHERKMKVFGGSQLRPNIHIEDMADAYIALIEAPKNKIAGEIFNVGSTNHSVNEISMIVKNVIGHDVSVINIPTEDNRSYHISSEKIKKILEFETKFTIEDAALDLKKAFETKKLVNPLQNEFYFNIKRMNSIDMV